MINRIPVFYHIPKCGGTYVTTKCREILRQHHKGIGNFIIQNDKGLIARIMLKKQQQLGKKHIKDFSIDLLESEILFVVILAHGIRLHEEILEKLQLNNTYKFVSLRNIYDRVQSLYNYVRSDESKHEKSHMFIKEETLEDYILSNHFELNWITTQFSANKNNNVDESDYTKAYGLIKSLNLTDLKKVDLLIEDCFKNCYKEIDINILNQDRIHRNHCKTNKIQFEDLSHDAQKIFLDKLRWDIKLYDELFTNQ